MTTPFIRLATLADLDAIRAIYNHYVATSTCTYQLELNSEEEQRDWFTLRSTAHPATVAELTGEVVGWGSIAPWKSRGGYAHTVEASVYVRPDSHRRGLGRAILLDLIERARAAGHHVLIGGASADQTASIALQESVGFERVGQFRQTGRKFGRWLDVVYMQMVLGNDREGEQDSMALPSLPPPV